MTTETLDKLYLEWSQFTKARTFREIAMLGALRDVEHSLKDLGADGWSDAPHLMQVIRAAIKSNQQ